MALRKRDEELSEQLPIVLQRRGFAELLVLVEKRSQQGERFARKRSIIVLPFNLKTRKAKPVMRRAQALLSFLLLLPSPAGAMQAPAGGADYAVKRREAIELWNQHKELEALPVFEDLAAQNPKDAQ